MARRYYNGAVRDYNIGIQSFPDVLLARAGGLSARSISSRPKPGQGAAPAIEFPGS